MKEITTGRKQATSKTVGNLVLYIPPHTNLEGFQQRGHEHIANQFPSGILMLQPRTNHKTHEHPEGRMLILAIRHLPQNHPLTPFLDLHSTISITQLGRK